MDARNGGFVPGHTVSLCLGQSLRRQPHLREPSSGFCWFGVGLGAAGVSVDAKEVCFICEALPDLLHHQWHPRVSVNPLHNKDCVLCPRVYHLVKDCAHEYGI